MESNIPLRISHRIDYICQLIMELSDIFLQNMVENTFIETQHKMISSIYCIYIYNVSVFVIA